MIKIVQAGNAVLRQVAKPVLPSEIGSPKIKKILADMSTALAGEEDGVAIAAPQIGVSLRIFVISGRVYRQNENSPLPADRVFINPTFKKLAKKKVVRDEGCLSVRPWYGKTKRAEKATVEALDETGKKFTAGGSSFLAQIYQHEIDHLAGILFNDHATELREMAPEKK